MFDYHKLVRRVVLQILALMPLVAVAGLVAGKGLEPRHSVESPDPSAPGDRHRGKGRSKETGQALAGTQGPGRGQGGDQAPTATQPQAGAWSDPNAREFRLPKRLPGGWELLEGAQRYDKESLFERINGAAPAYLDAGFVYSFGGEYQGTALEDPVAVDVYDMGTPWQALGMYAQERDSSYSFFPVGQRGYFAAGMVNFWQERFYVKMAGYGEGEDADRALAQLARALADVLPAADPTKTIATSPLALLPAQKRVAHSEGFTQQPLANVPGLAPVFFAAYAAGEKPLRLLVSRDANAKATQARWTQAINHFKRAGAGVTVTEASEAEPDGWTWARIQKDGQLSLLARKGAVLKGAVNLASAAQETAAKAILEQPGEEGQP